MSHDTWFTMPFLFQQQRYCSRSQEKYSNALQNCNYSDLAKHVIHHRRENYFQLSRSAATVRKNIFILKISFFCLVEYATTTMRNELTKTSSYSSQNDLVIHTQTARSGSAATWEVNTPCRSRHLLKACKSVGKKLQLRCSCKKRTKLSLMDRG